MASDYGDEAGSKMIDDFMRFGERMGERAMYTRASQMQRAFQNATQSAREAAGEAPAGNLAEWAKLDMHEFASIEDWPTLQDIIDGKLDDCGIAHDWHKEAQGKTYLLFRAEDAPSLVRAFDEMSRAVDAAKEKASAELAASSQGQG